MMLLQSATAPRNLHVLQSQTLQSGELLDQQHQRKYMDKPLDYINTTDSQAESLYSDSVKYYVLENLSRDPANNSEI